MTFFKCEYLSRFNFQLYLAFHTALHMPALLRLKKCERYRMSVSYTHLDVYKRQVIDEHTDLAYRERLAPLHPDDLPVMIDRLHAVAGYSNAKIRFRRDRVFRKADHFKVVLIQETACTG